MYLKIGCDGYCRKKMKTKRGQNIRLLLVTKKNIRLLFLAATVAETKPDKNNAITCRTKKMTRPNQAKKEIPDPSKGDFHAPTPKHFRWI